jgi:hypothetical protein
MYIWVCLRDSPRGRSIVDDPTEFVVEVDDEEALHSVLSAVEEVGGLVRHRYGKAMIVEIPAEAAGALRRAVPSGAHLLAPGKLARRAAPEGDSIESLGIAAARLRQSPEFRRSKTGRPNEGQEWGTGDQPEPDVGDDDDDPSAPRPPAGEP